VNVLVSEIVSARALRARTPVETAALVSVAAFAWAYVAIDWLALPRLFFLPLEDRIVWASQTPGPAIGYPGACLTAGLVAGIAAAIASRLGPERPGRRLGLATACSILVAMAYFVWRSWP